MTTLASVVTRRNVISRRFASLPVSGSLQRCPHTSFHEPGTSGNQQQAGEEDDWKNDEKKDSDIRVARVRPYFLRNQGRTAREFRQW